MEWPRNKGACHAPDHGAVMIHVVVGGAGVARTGGRSKRRPDDDSGS